MKMVLLPIWVKNMETKSSIRKKILAYRNTMPVEECTKKSMDIMNNLLSLFLLQKAEYILCYAGYKSEVMTTELTEELLKMGKQVYLPKVHGDEMDFYKINSLTDLVEGYKGIPEPSLNCKDIFTKDILEKYPHQVVMLLPGAAFSESGARIGYGKGYYDRYLERFFCEERIALCYEIQIVKKIPEDVHDIPVTAIVTEDKVRHILSSRESKCYFI